jgi:hypothetical protein
MASMLAACHTLKKSRKPEQRGKHENSPNSTFEKSLKRASVLNNKIALGSIFSFFKLQP